jgi:hypothetical protein
MKSTTYALIAVAAIAAFALLREHWSHVAGYWPYLLLLVCPLMHLFHGHGGHGDHQHQRRVAVSDAYQHVVLVRTGRGRVAAPLSVQVSFVVSGMRKGMLFKFVISGCRCPERQ